jgi:hypothetical protein
MQVNGLASSLLNLFGLNKSSATGVRATGGTAAASGPSLPPTQPAAGAALRALAAQYDVHDMTPRQFATLLHELQATAALPASELADLAQLRLSLDQAGFDPDEPLDLVAFVESQLRDADLGLLDMAQQAEQSPLRRQLAWLAKFDMLRHSEPLRAAA